MNSGLYVGCVRHRRFTPVKHHFVYPMFMPLIDLDELDALTKKVRGFGRSLFSFARFNASDYLHGERSSATREGHSLQKSIREKVQEETGEYITGKILLLCQLRYCGFYFSPLNLYYLYDSNNQWRYLLAEVSNTPWNQRHYYVIPANEKEKNDCDIEGIIRKWHNHIEPKTFHVSPFNPMSQQYHWRINEPSQRLMVHMENYDNDDPEKKVFDASMALKRQPFTTKVLVRLLLKTPIMAMKIVTGIYWQALRLWMKGAPFYPHPDLHQKNQDTIGKQDV